MESIDKRHRSFGAIALMLAILMAGVGVGCDRAASPTGVANSPLAEVRLGYFANLTHAQAVLGVSSGDFQNALGATTLKTKVFNAGPDLVQAINGGVIDIGYVGPGPTINTYASSKGESIRVISGAAANGVVIVARKDSGITSLKDLAGKKIATPQVGNTQDIAARHYVTTVLGQSDANILAIPNAQQSGAMARGQIDAAWAPEPWGARLISETGATIVAQEKEIWPGNRFALTVIVTTPKFLAEHPDVVGKILAVHHQWTVRLQTNPAAYADQLNDALAALAGKKLPADILKGAMDRTEFTDDPLPETFATMAQWSADLKYIKSVPDLSGLFETGIMRKIEAGSPATVP
jgi:NitT/TauT family transport system substrate-binding protein